MSLFIKKTMTFGDVWRILRQKPTKQPQNLTKKGKSEEERELELEERRNEVELNRLKLYEAKRMRFKKELEELQMSIDDDDDDGDYDDSNEDTPLMKLITPIIAGKLAEMSQKNPPQPQTNLNYGYVPPQFSDDQLRKIIRQIPKAQLKTAKIMEKDELFEIIKTKVPNLDERSFERGYQLLVTEF